MCFNMTWTINMINLKKKKLIQNATKIKFKMLKKIKFKMLKKFKFKMLKKLLGRSNFDE